VSVVNQKIYIHEIIDIVGHNRGRYMYHMTANWSPAAQEDRKQLCYGVWGVVGSTSRWPQVVNIWEEEGFQGLARSLSHELSHRDLQDPKLHAWWAAAASLRSGGLDRLLVPAPWMMTIEEACSEDVGAPLYAHETVKVSPGTSASHLELAREEAVPELERYGWNLIGAWRTALRDDSECIFLWAIPGWDQWAEYEASVATDPVGTHWQSRHIETTEGFERILLVDSALSPLRTGRQPSRSDRTEAWEG